jgi:hypothetical protein
MIESIPIVRLRYAAVSDLPPPQPGVRYVVSLPVLLASPDRTDLLTPAGQTRTGNRICTTFASAIDLTRYRTSPAKIRFHEACLCNISDKTGPGW